MSWEWEEFTQKANYRTEMIRVSLNARGHFFLNQKAAEALGNPEAVILLYERAGGLIGIRPSSSEVEHSYEIKRHGSSQNCFVRAKSFCNYYGVRLGETLVFNDIQVQEGMLVLDLGNVTEVLRRARSIEFPHQANGHKRPAQPIKFSNLLRMRAPDEE